MSESLAYLTSDELGGRQVGSEGNRLAQEYIVSQLAYTKLQPLDGQWLHPFEYKMSYVSSIELSCGEVSLSQYDVSLSACPADGCDLSGMLVSGEGPFDAPSIVLAEDIAAAIELIKDENVLAVVHPFEGFNLFGFFDEQKYAEKPILMTSRENWEVLSGSVGTEAVLKVAAEGKIETDNNIVGIIKAKNNPKNEALILGAHFDHIGTDVFGNVYPGAVDNASGTVTLLSLAKSLKLDADKMNRDIIVAFFNFEERSIYGSAALARELTNTYSNLYCLNFDCEGYSPDEKTVNLYGERTDVLLALAEEALTENGWNVVKTDFISDSVNFSCSVSIGSDLESVVFMHTPQDTADKVDVSWIEKLLPTALKLTEELACADDIKASQEDEIQTDIDVELNLEIYNLCSAISCKVLDRSGELTHIMSGYGTYVSEHWEKERFKEINDDEASAEFQFERYSSFPLISESLPELGFDWPECVFPVTVSVQTQEGRNAAKADRGASMTNIPLEGDVCPYTGLTVAEHEAGKVYYPDFGLENVVYLNASFLIEADKPGINIIAERSKKGEGEYLSAEAYYDQMTEEHAGYKLSVSGVRGVPCITHAVLDGDSAVCLMVICSGGYTTDELIQFMDDNGLWSLWDTVLGTWT